MAFSPGMKKVEGSGRKPGQVNKTTQTVKEAVRAAFEDVGGIEYLRKIAMSDPKSFLMLVSKLIPTQAQIEQVVADTKIFEAVKVALLSIPTDHAEAFMSAFEKELGKLD